MQRTMQNHAAVFRTGETLSEGVKKIREVHAGFADVKVSDRSLVWNSDLIETLELQNLLGQAVATMVSAERSEEHTSELQSLMRISYAVFCLKKKRNSFLIYS